MASPEDKTVKSEIINQDGTTTMASDEEARKIIEYCSKRVQRLASHSIDDLVAKCKEEKGKLDQIHKRKHLVINDPIHGTIKLNSLEKAIIDTPEFYRLRDIKQLGPLFHVYPGATHTRFEHSIGVCYIAGELVDHLEDEIKEVNENKDKSRKIILESKHKMCVRVAALCHDLGYGPFSHVFKKVSKKVINPERYRKRKELSRLIFIKILLDYPVVLALFRDYKLTDKHVKMIESMITGKPKYEEISMFETFHEEKLKLNFLYEIVNNSVNGMDVDKWDYFARDCYYLGLSNEFNWRRSMELSTIVKVKQKERNEHELHIGFRDKEVNNIYGMFRTRSVLHQKAYQHPKGKLIDLMIEDILILVQDVEIITINIDKKLTRISLKKALEGAFPVSEPADLTGYLALSDGILNDIMHAVPVETNNKETQTETQTDDCSLMEQVPTVSTFGGSTVFSSLLQARELIRRVQCREIYETIAERSVDEMMILNASYPKHLVKEDLIFFYRQALTEKQEASVDINQKTTKFTSEENIDPVKDIYFFEKEKIVGDFVEGEKFLLDNQQAGDFVKGKRKLNSGTTLQERVSKLNIPKVFKESRVIIYSKKKGIDKDDIRDKITFEILEAQPHKQ